jgi:hypothetical protein
MVAGTVHSAARSRQETRQPSQGWTPTIASSRRFSAIVGVCRYRCQARFSSPSATLRNVYRSTGKPCCAGFGPVNCGASDWAGPKVVGGSLRRTLRRSCGDGTPKPGVDLRASRVGRRGFRQAALGAPQAAESSPVSGPRRGRRCRHSRTSLDTPARTHGLRASHPNATG